jgi:hypothetical protein
MDKNVKFLPFCFDSSQAIRLLPDFQGHLFFLRGARGQKTPFGTNQSTVGSNHATFGRNHAIIWEQPNTIWEGSVQILSKITDHPKRYAISPIPCPSPPTYFQLSGRPKKIFGRNMSPSGRSMSQVGSNQNPLGSNQNTFGRSVSKFCQKSPIIP